MIKKVLLMQALLGHRLAKIMINKQGGSLLYQEGSLTNKDIPEPYCLSITILYHGCFAYHSIHLLQSPKPPLIYAFLFHHPVKASKREIRHWKIGWIENQQQAAVNPIQSGNENLQGAMRVNNSNITVRNKGKGMKKNPDAAGEPNEQENRGGSCSRKNKEPDLKKKERFCDRIG